MRLCQRHRIMNCATCGRTPGSKTPGVPATPEPSTTHSCESSRAQKILKAGTQLREEESEKCRKILRKTQRRLTIMNLRHLRRTPGTAGTCRCKIAETSTPCRPQFSARQPTTCTTTGKSTTVSKNWTTPTRRQLRNLHSFLHVSICGTFTVFCTSQFVASPSQRR